MVHVTQVGVFACYILSLDYCILRGLQRDVKLFEWIMNEKVIFFYPYQTGCY